MEKEHNCIKCKNRVFNGVTMEWECKYANIPNREECIEDYEGEETNE